MATLGPQIVTGSYGNLLKFIDIGEDGVETGQIRISDGKGKPTPLFLSTGSAYVSGALSASAEVVFSGLTSNAPGQYVSFDTSTGRLYFSNTSSIQNVVSASYAVTASYAMNADDGDWIIGSSYMTASGQTSVYIPNKLENGLTNKAQGSFSHAEGANTIAGADYSHAEGRLTSASGTWSHAEGNLTKTIGNFDHAEGQETLAEGIASHAEGYITSASNLYAHAEGQNTKAMGVASHAEGVATRADGWWSHAEGGATRADGDWSHSEGRFTTASGQHSHAEGVYTYTNAEGSHAEGVLNVTYGQYSHVEGVFNEILTGADYSHVGGVLNKSQIINQTVVGQNNDYTNEHPDDTFVVGTGNGPAFRADGFKVRANTHEVIIKQHPPSTLISIPPDPENDSGGPGLYFGEPDKKRTQRIISIPANNPTLPAYLKFQHHAGSLGYVDMVDFVNNSIAVFNP